ncbi:MAG: hypothetical protein GYA24_21325 [Candidatus Lokiarchaeota archaeon]|nr:hypothetical protein [Candidatus Lokiarchaeota archaeon]
MKRIVFVYNADSGVINSIKDYFHKVLKPETYECNLCQVTFGNLGMRKEWSEYIKRLPLPVDLLHRDEFIMRYPAAPRHFPAAFIESDGKLETIISAHEMRAVPSLSELMRLATERFKGTID